MRQDLIRDEVGKKYRLWRRVPSIGCMIGILVVGIWGWSTPTWASSMDTDAASEAERPKPAEVAKAAGENSEQPSNDSPLAVTTRVNPNPSHIGDELTLEITVAYPAGYTVNLPTGIKFEPFHRIEIQEGEIESTGTGLRKTFQIALQQFEVGEIKIPSFPITYVDAQGRVQTTTVPAKPIQVDSLLANEADPTRRGEDSPVSLKYPNYLAETIIYSAAASLLLAAFAAWAIVRYRRRVRPVYVPPPVPAHEQAFEALKGLDERRSEMVDRGEVQEYYVELTEVAKAYCQGRFGIDALDRTTEEIRRLLVRSPHLVEPLSGVEVIRFLEECDLVKFARFTPSLESAEEATGQVRNMVERSLEESAKGSVSSESKTNRDSGKDSSKEVA